MSESSMQSPNTPPAPNGSDEDPVTAAIRQHNRSYADRQKRTAQNVAEEPEPILQENPRPDYRSQ